MFVICLGLWRRKRTISNNNSERRGLGVEVYKGILQHNDASDCTVAIKRFNSEGGEGCDLFMNDIELLCQLRQPNTSVRLLVQWISTSTPTVMEEY
ncbi:hypothetical protein CR513_29461, partial [Mucuna pruriens]